MRIRNACLTAVFSLSLSQLASTAADPVEPSAISAYAGAYRGSTVFGGQFVNTARASFTGSRSKEIGTLRLTIADPGGSGDLVTETLAFRGNRVTYTFSPMPGSFVTGRGTARISNNVIRYTVPFSVEGSSYVMQGTTRKSNRRLNIKHNFTGSTSLLISYSLSKIGN